jgi:hypothetical protein
MAEQRGGDWPRLAATERCRACGNVGPATSVILRKGAARACTSAEALGTKSAATSS